MYCNSKVKNWVNSWMNGTKEEVERLSVCDALGEGVLWRKISKRLVNIEKKYRSLYERRKFTHNA